MRPQPRKTRHRVRHQQPAPTWPLTEALVSAVSINKGSPDPIEDVKIVEITNQDAKFYSLLGPFLSRREIVRERGAPLWDTDGKRWFIALQGQTVLGFGALEGVALVSAYVVPKYRRQGIYTALVKARVQTQEGPLETTARDHCIPALKQLGFKVVRRKGQFTFCQRA